MMGEGSAEDFVEAAVDTTKWGGSVEMAIAMDGTSTCIIIVHADQISDQASVLDVEGAFQPALLKGLTESVPKTHNMFAILRKGHYYLGYVRTEGIDRALFEVGDETEFAKLMLIKHLKSVNDVQRKRKKGQAPCLSDEDEPKAKASGRAAEPLSGPDAPGQKQREEKQVGKRKRGIPQQVSVSEDDEPSTKASARIRKQKHPAVSVEIEPASSEYAGKQKQREEKDCSDANNDESKDYDANQMVIYYTEEDPKVLLVGSVIEVVRYNGSEDEFLLLHRYGYVSQNKAAWRLDYTKSFRPAYHDSKDSLFDFTSKPQSAYTIVDHEIPFSNVKAKFEFSGKRRVPQGTVPSGKSITGLSAGWRTCCGSWVCFPSDR
jgi:hypothetical protein